MSKDDVRNLVKLISLIGIFILVVYYPIQWGYEREGKDYETELEISKSWTMYNARVDRCYFSRVLRDYPLGQLKERIPNPSTYAPISLNCDTPMRGEPTRDTLTCVHLFNITKDSSRVLVDATLKLVLPPYKMDMRYSQCELQVVTME